jgi:hypothetical protein
LKRAHKRDLSVGRHRRAISCLINTHITCLKSGALSDRAKARAWRMHTNLMRREQSLIEAHDAEALTGAQRICRACELSILLHDTFSPHPSKQRWLAIKLDRNEERITTRSKL